MKPLGIFLVLHSTALAIKKYPDVKAIFASTMPISFSQSVLGYKTCNEPNRYPIGKSAIPNLKKRSDIFCDCSGRAGIKIKLLTNIKQVKKASKLINLTNNSGIIHIPSYKSIYLAIVIS